jgi:hypothetical protein
MELGLSETQDARAHSALWLLRLPFLPSRLIRVNEQLAKDNIGEGSGKRT